EPVPLAAVKRKLEPLEPGARATLAAFMATVAQSGGPVTPAEIKILEKVYMALGVEQKQVFTDVHAAATGAVPAEPPSNQETGFMLDAAKISALQLDDERAAALLANIFTEEVAEASPPAAAAEEKDAAESPGLLGLDEAH